MKTQLLQKQHAQKPRKRQLLLPRLLEYRIPGPRHRQSPLERLKQKAAQAGGGNGGGDGDDEGDEDGDENGSEGPATAPSYEGFSLALTEALFGVISDEAEYVNAAAPPRLKFFGRLPLTALMTAVRDAAGLTFLRLQLFHAWAHMALGLGGMRRGARSTGSWTPLQCPLMGSRLRRTTTTLGC